MKHKIRKFFLLTVLLSLAVVYIARFGGPQLLKFYIKTGMGSCHDQKIFCALPERSYRDPAVDESFLAELKTYTFPEMQIGLPKEVKVVMGDQTRSYYKKRPWKTRGSVAYLLYRAPGFFIGLFPQLRKSGINDDYAFVARMMQARVEDISGIDDSFFVIIKSLFTPDLGSQDEMSIISFTLGEKRGFITFNLEPQTRYFDCNFFDAKDNYFKVYIKDKQAALDLPKVFAIISTVRKPG
jgi:hypothetical protein